MASYIVLANYTSQGIKSVKDSAKRLDSAKKLMKEFGVKLTSWYLTIGTYDLVFVLEAANDETVTRFVLTLTSRGNITTNTLKAFPEAEYRKIVGSLS
ncbi:MAG: GYD domain-containing protein [Rhodospirillales bacterium]|nr:GYD domain-containing protein [Rhodospirillales bacterium]